MKIITNKIFREKHAGNEYENPGRLVHFAEMPDTSLEDCGNLVHLVHSKDYVRAFEEACRNSREFGGTPTGPDTYETARYAVGTAIRAANMALDSKPGEGGFALIRPPGHHATPELPNDDRGLGFCFLSNAAICAKYLVNKRLKVFILDTDLHQGNGTQAAVEDDSRIFFFSMQQDGSWPAPYVNTEKRMKNYFNVVLPSGCSDKDYISRLERRAKILLDCFNPDIVLLDHGFDGYHKDFGRLGKTYRAEKEGSDEIEGLNLHLETYKKIQEMISEYRHFALLEGGYNPESIKEGIEAFVK